jgi:hypothetical protein
VHAYAYACTVVTQCPTPTSRRNEAGVSPALLADLAIEQRALRATGRYACTRKHGRLRALPWTAYTPARAAPKRPERQGERNALRTSMVSMNCESDVWNGTAAHGPPRARRHGGSSDRRRLAARLSRKAEEPASQIRLSARPNPRGRKNKTKQIDKKVDVDCLSDQGAAAACTCLRRSTLQIAANS